MRQHSSILITGASSGIGRALALAYAQPSVRLALIGRNLERLTEVAAAARAKGAEVVPVRLDVRDRTAMKDWMTAADASRPFDLVIAKPALRPAWRHRQSPKIQKRCAPFWQPISSAC
jgi:NADP-dependent 3-hydroxy acid dehydrogenase YdfG